MTWAAIILFLVSVQRLGELFLSTTNAKRQIARGGVESSKWQYPPIVVIHLAWFLGLWVLAWSAPVNWPLIGIYVVLQVLRVWTIATLGDRWSHRIIIVPGEPLITTGPYRYLKHPNYVVIVGEILVLPLAFGMPVFAIVLSVLNAIWIYVRVIAENRVLESVEAAPIAEGKPAAI